MYPTRIGLTYQGDQSFKTLIGGIVSNFIRLGILIIALLLTITIFQRGNVSTGINNIFKDLTNDETKHYFAKNNVYFALKLYGPHPEKLLDPSYFNLEFLQVNRIKTADSNSFSVLSTPIEYEYWGNKFPHVQEPIYSKVGLSTYIWPKNTDFYLRANFKSINYAIIQVNLVKWNGSQWKSDDEINSVLNTHYIDFEITSAYLDFNDFDNPVHTKIE